MTAEERIEIAQLHADNAALREGLQAYEAARQALFNQCFGNPIRDAWGKAIDCTKLNNAHELTRRLLSGPAAPGSALVAQLERMRATLTPCLDFFATTVEMFRSGRDFKHSEPGNIQTMEAFRDAVREALVTASEHR